MAVVTCNKGKAYYFRTVINGYTGESSTDTNSGIRYGRGRDIYGNQYIYDAYIEFDISAVLRSRVKTVTLVRNRSSIAGDENSSSTPVVRTSIRQFHSNDPEKPSMLPTFANLTYVGNTLALTAESVTSGLIRTNITSSFDPAGSVSGITGIRFYSGNDYGHAMDADVWLEIDADALPSLAPTSLLPVAVQNPPCPYYVQLVAQSSGNGIGRSANRLGVNPMAGWHKPYCNYPIQYKQQLHTTSEHLYRL